jgi:multidrug resistance efflux pump
MEPYPVLTARAARAPAEPATAARGRTSYWLVVIGLLSLAASVTVAGISFHPLTRPGPAGEEPSAGGRRAVAVAYVDVEGGVRPLYPAAPGRVTDAPVPEGKEMPEGTVLLQIDDSLAQARLKEAEVELKAAEELLVQKKKLVPQHKTKVLMQEAALDAAKKKLEAAEIQAKKVQRMVKDKAIQAATEDLEAARKLVEEAKAMVRYQKAQLDLAESFDPTAAVRLAEFDVAAKREHVEKAKLGVRECQILAPSKGVVLRRMVNVGEVLGATANRPAIEFCPSGERIVRAEVEQEFAGNLFVGQKARICDEITGKGEWRGEVLRISDWYTKRRTVLVEPMQYNDTRTLEVIIRLRDDPKNPLRINQRVRVQLDGES